jgi:hypothetical protein
MTSLPRLLGAGQRALLTYNRKKKAPPQKPKGPPALDEEIANGGGVYLEAASAVLIEMVPPRAGVPSLEPLIPVFVTEYVQRYVYYLPYSVPAFEAVFLREGFKSPLAAELREFVVRSGVSICWCPAAALTVCPVAALHHTPCDGHRMAYVVCRMDRMAYDATLPRTR